jgi:MFS family permease
MVVATGILSSLGFGFYTNGLSVFFKDVSSDVGLSRAMTSFAAGFGQLEGGVMSPLTGWLADRFGPRWVIFAGICITATGVAMMRFIVSPWQYFVAWGLLAGIGVTIGFTIAVDKTVTNWFVRKRGLALSIKYALLGIGTVVLLPVVAHLVAGFGWRTTCLMWSLVLFACAPLTLMVIKQERPEHYGLLPDGAGITPGRECKPRSPASQSARTDSPAEEQEFTFRQAIRTGSFWLIALAFAIFVISSGGIRIHVVPFLTDMGIARTFASGMMSMMVFFMIPARFVGIIADRVKAAFLVFLLAGAFALTTAGIGIFILHPCLPTVYVMLIAYGLSSGAVSPLIVLILGRYFGRKAFGSIFGTCMMIQAPAQLLGSVYAGRIYDTTGSYMTAFVSFLGLSACAAIVVCFVTAPKSAANAAPVSHAAHG